MNRRDHRKTLLYSPVSLVLTFRSLGYQCDYNLYDLNSYKLFSVNHSIKSFLIVIFQFSCNIVFPFFIYLLLFIFYILMCLGKMNFVASGARIWSVLMFSCCVAFCMSCLVREGVYIKGKRCNGVVNKSDHLIYQSCFFQFEVSCGDVWIFSVSSSLWFLFLFAISSPPICPVLLIYMTGFDVAGGTGLLGTCWWLGECSYW